MKYKMKRYKEKWATKIIVLINANGK